MKRFISPRKDRGKLWCRLTFTCMPTTNQVNTRQRCTRLYDMRNGRVVIMTTIRDQMVIGAPSGVTFASCLDGSMNIPIIRRFYLQEKNSRRSVVANDIKSVVKLSRAEIRAERYAAADRIRCRPDDLQARADDSKSHYQFNMQLPYPCNLTPPSIKLRECYIGPNRVNALTVAKTDGCRPAFYDEVNERIQL